MGKGAIGCLMVKKQFGLEKSTFFLRSRHHTMAGTSTGWKSCGEDDIDDPRQSPVVQGKVRDFPGRSHIYIYIYIYIPENRKIGFSEIEMGTSR